MANGGPTITGSAAIHAERIQARDAELAAAQKPDGRQTFERYAERALARARADEELREQARLNDMRVRGQWVPGDEPEDQEDDGVEEVEEEDVEDEEDAPTSTAELYARRERERQAAERKANVRAHAGMVQTMDRPLAPQRPPTVAQPHRYAHAWEKPAS
ncbi:hypothetical protein [Streptomyces adustus]|uniref:hypothetical protein n=1 Tax=Streptomyces adustus TaxID=1609272 RepID=UPI00371A1E7A